RDAEALKALKGPVLGHFAEQDKWINKEMVDGFIEQMKLAGQPAPEVYWYDADHAFANPSGGRYDREDAQLAWSRSLAFLQKNLTAGSYQRSPRARCEGLFSSNRSASCSIITPPSCSASMMVTAC